MTAPAASPASLLFPDLEQELATTRRFLERYPDGRADWQPHAKSMAIGRLASHVAELPALGGYVMTGDEYDFMKQQYQPTNLDSAAELVAHFDEQAGRLRAAITGADWAGIEREWTLRAGEHVIMRGPRGAVLRTLYFNHAAHHRAQLGVYYRMLDVPVPGTYGPSADEQ